MRYKRIILNTKPGGVADTLTTCYARASATNFLGSKTTGVKPYNTRLVCVMVIVSKEKYEAIQNYFVEQGPKRKDNQSEL